MIEVNKYFDGNMVSVAFRTETQPATVGVMQAGEYDFSTTLKETMTVISGALFVKFPGSKDWRTYTAGEQFTVEAKQDFLVKVAMESAWFCTYGEAPKKQAPAADIGNNRKIITHNQRRHDRYHVGHYPVAVQKHDGTVLKAVLRDISYRGFQIACTGLTARMLSRDTGLLAEHESQLVALSVNIEEGEKIVADCSLVYVAKNDDVSGTESYAVGLQVIDFKGNSLDIIKRLVKTRNARGHAD